MAAMAAKKRAIKSDLKKVDRHRIARTEYDEAPELTKRATGQKHDPEKCEAVFR